MCSPYGIQPLPWQFWQIEGTARSELSLNLKLFSVSGLPSRESSRHLGQLAGRFPVQTDMLITEGKERKHVSGQHLALCLT